MPTLSNGHVLAVTSDHLAMIKDTLKVVIGDHVKPTHRLEIFSRICGYRTWASLQAASGAIPDSPLLLAPQIMGRDPFIDTLPADVRRRLARMGPQKILDLVLAGLDRSWDPVFGYVGLDEDDTEDMLEAHFSGIRDLGGTTPFSKDPGERVLVLASPENTNSLGKAALKGTPREGEDVDFRSWAAAEVELVDGGIHYEVPNLGDVVTGTPGDLLATWPEYTKLIFFAEEDREAFLAAVREVRPGYLGLVDQTLQKAALELESETGKDFFWIGYHGTARMDIVPIDELNESMAVLWAAEILNIVHGLELEERRLMSE